MPVQSANTRPAKRRAVNAPAPAVSEKDLLDEVSKWTPGTKLKYPFGMYLEPMALNEQTKTIVAILQDQKPPLHTYVHQLATMPWWFMPHHRLLETVLEVDAAVNNEQATASASTRLWDGLSRTWANTLPIALQVDSELSLVRYKMGKLLEAMQPNAPVSLSMCSALADGLSLQQLSNKSLRKDLTTQMRTVESLTDENRQLRIKLVEEQERAQDAAVPADVSYKWADWVESTADPIAECANMVQRFQGKYPELARKAAKVCSAPGVAVDHEKVNELFARRQTVSLKRVDPAQCLDKLLELIASRGAKTLPVQISAWDVTFKNQSGVGEGTVRTFLSLCAAQLLLPETKNENAAQGNEGSVLGKRRGPQQASTSTGNADQSGLTQLFVAEDSESGAFTIARKYWNTSDVDTVARLQALGWLIVAMAVNDGMALPVALKRGILHKCLYRTKASKDLSYAVYQLMEDPRNGMFVPLTRSMNQEEEEEWFSAMDTSAGEYMAFIRQAAADEYTPAAFDHIAEGFRQAGGQKLRQAGYDVRSLHKQVCSGVSAKMFKERIRFRQEVPKQLQDWLLAYIDKASQDTLAKLAYFWGSSYGLKPAYQVAVEEWKPAARRIAAACAGTPNANANANRRAAVPLPSSHTCFSQLVFSLQKQKQSMSSGSSGDGDARKYAVPYTSDADFKDAMDMAITGAEEGVGLAGGGRRRMARRSIARPVKKPAGAANTKTGTARGKRCTAVKARA